MIKELEMKYLVLKMNDDIDIQYLIDCLQDFKKLGRDDYYNKIPVNKIALHLVNAVLKTQSEINKSASYRYE